MTRDSRHTRHDATHDTQRAGALADRFVAAAASFVHETSTDSAAMAESATSWLADGVLNTRNVRALAEPPAGSTTAELLDIATWTSAQAALVEVGLSVEIRV